MILPEKITSRSVNVGSMLNQRRTRWLNIGPVLVECLISAGIEHLTLCFCVIALDIPLDFLAQVLHSYCI